MSAEATCERCGCTDSNPCPGGCTWVWVDYKTGQGVCSSCTDLTGPAELAMMLED